YMTATVLDDRGGRPTRVSFQFTAPLDHPSLVFLALAGGELRRLALPKLGEAIDLPRPQTLAAALR
ncbi:MAG TPA: hypothetical protein VHO06_27915, partial [Polyangia bacterium]|nr:hypothetical protein [Polyangia bacterium]